MSGDIHLRDFTVPLRPGGRPAWRFTPARFAAGVGAALLTHVPLNVLLVLWAGPEAAAWLVRDARSLPALLVIAFALTVLGCGGGAGWALHRRDSGLGIGLLTGWVIGLIPAVVVFLSMLSAVPGT